MTKLRGWLVVLAILAAGCSTHDDNPNRAYDKVFRGRWWNYYDRGVWHLSEGRYEAAQADFGRAASGRSRDAWSARTYGLHFQEYFPNRELGVAYYELGMLDEAESALRASLAEVDSARAHFYLDRITRDRIASGALTDDRAPALTPELADGAVVATREVAFAVKADDDVGVAEVAVNGQRLYQRASFLDDTLSETLDLDEGEHSFTVTATDLAGKESERTVTIRTDFTAPTVIVTSPAPEAVTPDSRLALRARIVDAAGVGAVRLGEATLADGGGAPSVDVEASLPIQAGENLFVLTAFDAAGNENRVAVRVFGGDRRTADARLWWLKHRAPERLQLASLNPAAVAAVLESAYAATAPIDIVMDFPVPPDDTEREYAQSELTVKGKVVATAQLASLNVGAASLPVEGASPAEGEIAVAFERRVNLAVGPNAIEVAATDVNGASDSETFAIQAAEPLADSSAGKLPVAVLGFWQESGGTYTSSVNIAEMLAGAIADRFTTVDRRNLEDILVEQQLSDALANPDTAIRLGNIFAAQFHLAGYSQKFNAQEQLLLTFVDTETTKVERVDTVITDSGDLTALEAGIADLAAQIKARFPRVLGKVIRTQGPVVVSNYTRADGVTAGNKFLVLYEEIPAILDDATGGVLVGPTYGIAGKANLLKVDENASTGKLIDSEAAIEAEMPTVTW